MAQAHPWRVAGRLGRSGPSQACWPGRSWHLSAFDAPCSSYAALGLPQPIRPEERLPREEGLAREERLASEARQRQERLCAPRDNTAPAAR
mmetsp:Transcript_116030/g.370182  ORF Transcript_116030/g.370182 Transcript_116030/m.370182 type:complete len:91 (+) Transcript_116030:2-274(+)